MQENKNFLPAIIDDAIIPEEIPNEPEKPKRRPIVGIICQSKGEFGHILPSLPLDSEYICILNIWDAKEKLFDSWTVSPYGRKNKHFFEICEYFQSILSRRLSY
jgi:hypothetical protein